MRNSCFPQEKKANIGFAVLSFFFPLIGLIIYIVFKNSEPKTAKLSVKCALFSVLFRIIISLFATFLLGLSVKLFENTLNSITTPPTAEEELNINEESSYFNDIKFYYNDCVTKAPSLTDDNGYTEYELNITVKNLGTADYNLSPQNFSVYSNFEQIGNYNMSVSYSTKVVEPNSEANVIVTVSMLNSIKDAILRYEIAEPYNTEDNSVEVDFVIYENTGMTVEDNDYIVSPDGIVYSADEIIIFFEDSISREVIYEFIDTSKGIIVHEGESSKIYTVKFDINNYNDLIAKQNELEESDFVIATSFNEIASVNELSPNVDFA